jgi:hypothetical protein
MKKLVFDVEANGFINDATTIWCISTYDIISKDTITFSNDSDDCPSLEEGLELLANADELIGHNIIM